MRRVVVVVVEIVIPLGFLLGVILALGEPPAAGAGTYAIGAGGSHTCALRQGGVWCWGLNNAGQLGNNSTTDSSVPVAVLGLGSGVSGLSTGYNHNCALKNGGVLCWGWNGFGQLGNDSTSDSSTPVTVVGLESGVSAISAGEYHTCALKDGDVWCWGRNDFGQLGTGSNAGPQFCASFPSAFACSTVPAEVPAFGQGPAGGVAPISTGWGHTCAVKGAGAWCWGRNNYGQLGTGNLTASVSPQFVSGAFDTGVTAISAGLGGNHTCALKDGNAWCWGWNSHGQVGNASTADSRFPDEVDTLGSGVSAISAGGAHTCGLKDGGVSCWGYNLWGQLGNDSTTDSSVPVATSGLTSGATAISAGYAHTCALKDGDVWCWGYNAWGQLGNNSTTDSSVPVAVLFPPPPSVGGIAEQPDVGTLPSAASSGRHYTVYIVGGILLLATIGAAGWHARRKQTAPA